MSNQGYYDFLPFRRGTSQQERQNKALAPDYFQVDERSLKDLLEFAQQYAQSLLFYNERLEAEGDWGPFLEGNVDEIVAYLKNPGAFDHRPELKQRFEQPHFVLFLTFLSLLQEVQENMNQITHRQLDFYYRKALGLQPKKGRVDQVHLVAELDPVAADVMIEANTLLSAGTNSEGQEVLYEVQDNLLANQAKILTRKSVFIEKKVEDFYLIREKNKEEKGEKLLETFQDILRLTYRLPGTDDTPRPFPGNLRENRILDVDLIKEWDALQNFIGSENQLNLKIAEFQYIIELFTAWQNPLNWHRPEAVASQLSKEEDNKKKLGINDYLVLANAKLREKNPSLSEFKVEEIDDLQDFHTNLKAATGFDLNGNPTNNDDSNLYANIDGVENIYDLYFGYERLLIISDQSRELKYQTAINKLGFFAKEEPDTGKALGVGNPSIIDSFRDIQWFREMMALRMSTLENLREIIEILGGSGAAVNQFIEDFQPNDTVLSNLFQTYKPGLSFQFIAPDQSLLTINQALVDPLTIEGLKESWSKEPSKGGFSIEIEDVEGMKTFDITSDNAPKSLNPCFDYFLSLKTDQPGVDLNVSFLSETESFEFTAEGKSFKKEVSINPPSVKVIYDASLSKMATAALDDETGGLVITIRETEITVANILKAFEASQISIYELFVEDPNARLLSPADGVQLFLQKRPCFKLEIAGLLVAYYGSALEPKVKIVSNDSSPLFATSFPTVNDDYYLVKAQQLKQLESYMRMEATDYFSIRALFNAPPPGEGDWQYKDPAWVWRETDQQLIKAHQEINGTNALPEILRWKNLFIAENAEKVIVPTFEKDEKFPRWKTFGRPIREEDPGDHKIIQVGDLGIMIASSALRLSEGKRTIRISWCFDKDHFDEGSINNFLKANKVELPLQVWISTEKEWLPMLKESDQITIPTIEEESQFAEIIIELKLNEDIPPLAPISGENFPSLWPAIRLTLNDVTDNHQSSSYDVFSKLMLEQVKLNIKVEGLQTLQIQNQDGPLDINQPFEPFGLEPRQGSKFYFTHPELVHQRLDELSVHLTWEDAFLKKNDGLKDYYQLYSELPGEVFSIAEDTFKHEEIKAAFRLREAHRSLSFTDLGNAGVALFKTGSDTNDIVYQPTLDDQELEERKFESSNVKYNKIGGITTTDDVFEGDRYLELELIHTGFLHDQYVALQTWIAQTGFNLSVNQSIEEKELAYSKSSHHLQLKLSGFPVPGATPEDFSIDSPMSQFSPTKYDKGKKLLTARLVALKIPLNVESFDPNELNPTNYLAVLPKEDKGKPFVSVQKIVNPNQEGQIIIGTNGGLEIWVKEGETLVDRDLISKASVEVMEMFDFQFVGSLEAGVVKDIAKINNFLNRFNFSTGNTPFELAPVTVNFLAPLILPEPYIPLLSSFSVDYQTNVKIEMPQGNLERFRSRLKTALEIEKIEESVTSEDETLDLLIHLHPFGYGLTRNSGIWEKVSEEIDNQNVVVNEKKYFPFLPSYQEEGYLYLGIEQLLPPQELSLFFQFAEGSGNPDVPIQPVLWSYLGQTEWKEFMGTQMAMDTTSGLQKSGIVKLRIPSDASTDNSLMPKGLHWLRIRVEKYAHGLNDTVSILSQGLRAIKQNPQQWLKPGEIVLPPETLSDPVAPIPGLLQFHQPFASFDGKNIENQSHFYLRVSEQLRHKSRGITMWDYERLVLEAFPDIYRVKVLAADLFEDGQPPGTVSIYVIPDVKHRRPFNPFEPKVPQIRLEEIQTYLEKFTPPFANIQVRNPNFEYVHVRTSVKFHDMHQFSYYAGLLEEEIKAFLSPWAFNEGGEITFGREIYVSMIVNLIETRPYVDFIDQCKLILMEKRRSTGTIHPIEGTEIIGKDGNVILRYPNVILVSAPSHSIDFLDTSIPPEDRIFDGIGYAKVDLDFKVAIVPKN